MEHKLGPAGLQKRFTYNELVNYVEKDPDKISYPSRAASRAWDSIFRVDFSSDAPMAALMDEYAQANAPGNVPYVPPSDRPAGPSPPPADEPGTSPPDETPPPWWRHLPTPIPLDPNYFINRVNGNGGPDSYIHLDDAAEPLLPNDYLGPPPGPGGGGIPNPAHQAVAAQEAAAEAHMNAIAEAASQTQVTHEVLPHEAPVQPEDAYIAEMNGTAPPPGDHPFSDALNQIERGRAAAALAGIAALAGGAGSLAGSVGKSAASAAPALASNVAGAAAAAGSAVLNVAGSTFHAADAAVNYMAGTAAHGVDSLEHMSGAQMLGTALGTAAAVASVTPQAALDSLALGSTLTTAGAGLYLLSQHGFTNAMQQAMPSAQHHATQALHHIASHNPTVPEFPIIGYDVPNHGSSETSTRVPLMLPSSSSSSSSSSRPPARHDKAYWYNASDEEIEEELKRRRVPRREWVGHSRSYKIETLLNYIKYDTEGLYRGYQK